MVDPYAMTPDTLYDAYNLYSPAPGTGVGMYSRPGLTLLNSASQLGGGVGSYRGQGVISHHDLAGNVYNFLVVNGKLYIADSTQTVYTDVTPVGVAIDGSITTRVYGTSFNNQLIITDGVHRPWIATNLSSTPITGTYIDEDGSATAWTAFGPAVQYGGALFFILNTYNGTSYRTDFVWSAPGDASTGYEQSPYSNRWTYQQANTNPLFGMAGTNTQLYIFRAYSIGSISGVVGPNLASTVTHDLIAQNIGTQAPQSIQQLGELVYFVDAVGRPYRIGAGNILTGIPGPEPIYRQLQAIIDAQTLGFPAITKYTCTATIEPTLNIYLVAIFSVLPSQTAPPIEMYAFDALSGNYLGRWNVASGCQIDALGAFFDVNGRGTLVVLGSKVVPPSNSVAASGYVWSMNALNSPGDFITTEDGLTSITTEDGLTFITTEGSTASWTDNGALPQIQATTYPLGYDTDLVAFADQVSVLVGSQAPINISAQTAALSTTLNATPTPNASTDSTYRAVAGLDGVQGRGIRYTISPTTATSRWAIQQVKMKGNLIPAGPEE